MNSPFIFSQSSTGAQTVPTTTIVIISARIAFFFSDRRDKKDLTCTTGAAVQWQSAELVLLFSFFSTMAISLSLSKGGLFFPSFLFEAIPTTSISSNKQNKKWPSRQNKNKMGERQKRRIRKKENGKQWERENLNREYKRGGGTYIHVGKGRKELA